MGRDYILSYAVHRPQYCRRADTKTNLTGQKRQVQQLILITYILFNTITGIYDFVLRVGLKLYFLSIVWIGSEAPLKEFKARYYNNICKVY